MPPKRVRHLAAPSDAIHSSAARRRTLTTNSPLLLLPLPPAKRRRTLQHGDLQSRLRVNSPSFHEPLQEVPLEMVTVRRRRKRAISSSSSASSSSEAPAGIDQDQSRKERQLKTRSKRRLQKHLDEILENSGGSLTFLERRAVGQKVEKYYDLEMGFMEETAKLDLVATSRDAEASDRMLVEVFNKAFLAGHQSDKGDRMIASFMHRFPQFGRKGNQKLPRTWRALKGWRKLTPRTARYGLPWMVWRNRLQP